MNSRVIVPRISYFFGQTLKLDDFEKVENQPLGQGSYGKVFLYRHKFSGKQYAIKQILLNRKQKINREELQSMTKKQIEILYKIDNNHIVKLLDHFETKDSIYLITEYLQGVNLYELCFKHGKKLTHEEIADIIYQTCVGLEELHGNHILHRDIKLQNLMYHNGNIKIVDLGCSNFYGQHIQRKTKIGTRLYYSPEVLLHQQQNDRLDVWCLGVVLFQLLFGKQPFIQPDIQKKIRRIQINYSLFKMQSQLRDLFQKIFVEKKSRIDIYHFKNHPWIKKNRGKNQTYEPQFQDFYTQLQVSNYRDYLKQNINSNCQTLLNLRQMSSGIENELKQIQRELKNKRKR